MLRARVPNVQTGLRLWRSCRALSAAAPEKPFDKVLIANRGEIACRVMRTCKKMGIKTVAIYSDPDARSKHVLMADEAYNVGTAQSSNSYLRMDVIMDVIKKSGAQAVHPGYGFLSENTRFSALCKQEGVVFIGPDPYSIEAMGDKINSKRLAADAGVNCIPGFKGEVPDAETAVTIAEQIGYPVMIKASAGGGGKGMRVAYNKKEVMEGYRLSRDEARASFGDDRMLIEKFIENPHHIEIQVLGDSHGNVVAFPERECSVQRRNQKVVEESPSCLLTPATRSAMQEQAIMLAKAVKYNSAGTVEMLCDDKQNFYFLEMNTRLQVEHPITEYVTGEDLVEHMLWSAAGKPLPERLIQVKHVPFTGHAIEARVYAEDPVRGFLPSIGPLVTYIEPNIYQNDDGKDLVRIDTGVFEGGEISMYYDPMIAKLVTYGHTRDNALATMRTALDEYVIQGLGNNLAFLRDVMRNPVFSKGHYSTKFISEQWPSGFTGVKLTSDETSQLVAVAAAVHEERMQLASDIEGRLEAAPDLDSSHLVCVLGGPKGTAYNVLSTYVSPGCYSMEVTGPDGNTQTIDLNNLDWQCESALIRVDIQDETLCVQYRDKSITSYDLRFMGSDQRVIIRSPLEHALSHHMLPPQVIDYSSVLRCPMPGTLLNIAVQEGQHVEDGQELAVVEAMKMQNILRSFKSGTIGKIKAKKGEHLKVDQVILEFATV